MKHKEKILKLLESVISNLKKKAQLLVFLKCHHKIIFNWIMTNTEFLDKYEKNGKPLSIYERLYCIAHDLYDRPLCKKCNKNHVVGFDTSTNQYKKWCSPSCQASDIDCISKSKSTRIQKYGDEKYVGIEKARITRYEKNNGKWLSDDFADKVKATKLKNHGDPNWTNSEKAKNTIQQKLKENPDFWHDREQKTKQTKILNGHSENWNNRSKFKDTLRSFSKQKKTSILEKRKQTNKERYGHEYPQQRIEIQEKTKSTNLDKYGVTSPLKIDGVRQKSIYTIKDKAWQNIMNSIDEYTPIFTKDEFINNTFPNKYWQWKCNNCGNIFLARYDNGHHCICRKCHPIQYSYISYKENDLFDYLKQYVPDAIHNDRTVLNGKELDIYMPSKKIAIEFDGIYWHSDLIKDNNYHLNKTLACEKNNIQLIHVFENEWDFKQQLVKSRIKNMLGLYDKTVFARKCEVREVNAEESNSFQEQNHLQGSVNAKVKLGLFYEDELISLMTFGKCRFDKKHEWEMLRFCNKLGYHIPGAASKLLKHFERNYTPKSLVSYADRRWSQGKLYEALGFKLDHASAPNY